MMGALAQMVYAAVLEDLCCNNTDTLEELLQELPVFARDITMGSAEQSAPIRRVMDHLLKTEGLFAYFQRMLDYLGLRILLHEAYDETPHLLSQVVRYCDETYVLKTFGLISSLREIDPVSAYVLPFQGAYETGKYHVLNHLYINGFACNIQVDEAVCGSLHPLCFAADHNDWKFAKAFMDAAQGQRDLGICRNSRREDPDCCEFPTVLEHIVRSGSVEVMRLVLSRGAVNALTREGFSLLDVAPNVEIRQMLVNKGGEAGDPKDHLLHMSLLGVKTHDEERLSYIAELMETAPYHTCAFNTETDICKSYWKMDLLVEIIGSCDVEALQLIKPSMKERLHGPLTTQGLKLAVKNCVKQKNGVNCVRLAELLRVLYENSVQHFYEKGRGVFVLQMMQDLIFHEIQEKSATEETLADICYYLCSIYRLLDPVDIYSKAQRNVFRPDWGEPISSPETVEALFVTRGWKIKKKGMRI